VATFSDLSATIETVKIINLPYFVEYADIYGEYCIRKVKVEYIPKNWNQVQDSQQLLVVGGVVEVLPVAQIGSEGLYTYWDPFDQAVFTGQSQCLAMQACRETRGPRYHIRTSTALVPFFVETTTTPVTTSITFKSNQWFSTLNDTDQVHYLHNVILAPQTVLSDGVFIDVTNIKYERRVTMHVSFRYINFPGT